MDNKKRLCLEDAVTKAEIYAVKVIEEELNRKGIAPNSIERKIIITRTADVLAAHKEEVRDMYKKSGLLLQDWIIKMSGIKDLIAFKKMKQLGFTGDVMGWFTHTDTYGFYEDHIKPYVNIKQLKKKVSKHSKKGVKNNDVRMVSVRKHGQADRVGHDIKPDSGLSAKEHRRADQEGH